MTQEERHEIIEGLIHDRAWGNHRRVQIEEYKVQTNGIAYNSQDVLDQFRDFLCDKLAYITDDNIPIKHSDCWEFIYARWAEFIQRSYGIIQTWEEYKNSDAYRLARCKV